MRTLAVQPLRGGLESEFVVLVRASCENARGRHTLRFITKRVGPAQAREAVVHRTALPAVGRRLGPQLLGEDGLSDGGLLLHMEEVRPRTVWPWSDAAMAARALDTLVPLHDCRAPQVLEALSDWDYESFLLTKAEEALDAFEGMPRRFLPYDLLRTGPSLRRLVLNLPRLRGQLLDFAPFGRAALHGDVHSGNVMLARTEREDELLLLDWARARVGSPLEDVSSWIQSLGLWEPEAKRRHDTLLNWYLQAWGAPVALDGTLRGAYWLASASNVLSGAFTYYLWRIAEALRAGVPSQVAEALGPAQTWARVLRRADALSS